MSTNAGSAVPDFFGVEFKIVEDIGDVVDDVRVLMTSSLGTIQAEGGGGSLDAVVERADVVDGVLLPLLSLRKGEGDLLGGVCSPLEVSDVVVGIVDDTCGSLIGGIDCGCCCGCWSGKVPVLIITGLCEGCSGSNDVIRGVTGGDVITCATFNGVVS